MHVALGQGVYRAVEFGREPIRELVAVAMVGVAANVCGAVEDRPANRGNMASSPGR
jgi:Flp pilus assembly pilin Flp